MDSDGCAHQACGQKRPVQVFEKWAGVRIKNATAYIWCQRYEASLKEATGSLAGDSKLISEKPKSFVSVQYLTSPKLEEQGVGNARHADAPLVD